MDIDDHDQRIRGVFTRAYESSGWVPVYDHTPMHEMLQAEAEVDLDNIPASEPYAWPSEEQPDLELRHLKAEEAAQVAAWARQRLIYWLAGDGIHPFQVLQRFYAICYARYSDLLGPLNGAWLATILGQGRAAFSALMQRLFNVPIKAKTGVEMICPGQKSPNARAKYAENARAVKPRQQVAADFGSDKDADEETRVFESDLILEAAQRLAQQREDQKNEEFFRQMRDKAKQN